jgi:hypothetical protein
MNHVDGQVTRVSVLTFTRTSLGAAQLHDWGSYLPLLGCMQHVGRGHLSQPGVCSHGLSDDGLDACQDTIVWGT